MLIAIAGLCVVLAFVIGTLSLAVATSYIAWILFEGVKNYVVTKRTL